ncbi:MFS transporter [Tepidibacillus sp. HK-1]|uniref:MFS transporter n=1 Tax=Tepidibacillus sp. HK-1 TaxID=1883407 RepID=UPI000853A35C|nr:MFS transporter [Tepidibacillus sp. HK-1]GBF11244.1 putative 3-phenylpropionic acid transporter [Tepidibacillus sp. HK-1]
MEAIAYKKSRKKIYTNLSGFYLLFFFGVGALYPSLSVYFKEQGLGEGQIGLLMSIGPVVAIIVQPLWGMICDRFRIEKKILFFTLLAAGFVALIFPYNQSYAIFILLNAALSLFQSAVVPISDNISMNFVHNYGGNYGDIRLWGAIGFAVAVWVAGTLSDLLDIQIIFYLYALFLGMAALITFNIPNETGQVSIQLFQGIRDLLKIPKFLIFLLGTFLLFGSINANNTYFGLFFKEIGGSMSGFGLAFLLAAGSEAPLMRVSGFLIRKFGLLPILLFSALVTTGRWLFYSFSPSVSWVLATTFVQGFSVGLYVPTAAQFVREISPKEMQVTAMSLYGSFGLGLGSMAVTMMGGWISEHYGMMNTYLFMAGTAFVGFFVFLSIWIMERK